MYRILRNIMLIIAVITSDIMCADIAYSYCDMLWGIRHMAYSTPASMVFFLIIPYCAIILLCLALAVYFNRKHKKEIQKKINKAI